MFPLVERVIRSPNGFLHYDLELPDTRGTDEITGAGPDPGAVRTEDVRFRVAGR